MTGSLGRRSHLSLSGGSRARGFAAKLYLQGKVHGLKRSKLTTRHSHEDLGKRRVTQGFVGTKTKNKLNLKNLSAQQQVNKTAGRLNNGKKCSRRKHREEKATYPEENAPVDLSEKFHGFR